MRTSRYFDRSRARGDRVSIREEWVLRVVERPEASELQGDGRLRLWGYIVETDRYLRVILLEDGETIHNAFFDRNYRRSKR